MKKNGHITAFYLETLLLITVFIAIILVLTQVFGLAQMQSSRAKLLTDAVISAQNAAEAFSAAESPEELAKLLGEGTVVTEEPVRLQVKDRGFWVEMDWRNENGYVESTIQVYTDSPTAPLYTLETAGYKPEVRP